MNNPIKVYVKSVYGVDRTYVADPIVAQAIVALTNAKTLEDRHMSALRALGFTFEQVIDPSLVAKAKYGATLV